MAKNLSFDEQVKIQKKVAKDLKEEERLRLVRI